jgi:hypothetical protein
MDSVLLHSVNIALNLPVTLVSTLRKVPVTATIFDVKAVHVSAFKGHHQVCQTYTTQHPVYKYTGVQYNIRKWWIHPYVYR